MDAQSGTKQAVVRGSVGYVLLGDLHSNPLRDWTWSHSNIAWGIGDLITLGV